MIRRSLPITVIIVLAALLLAVLPVSAAAPQGTIQGTIANGTTGALPDQPLLATLNAYLNGDLTNTQNVQAAADGTFAFTGLDTGTDYTYQVQVKYNDVTFTGDPLTFSANETSLNTTVDIYETTSDLSVLDVSMAHIVVYTTGSDLTVTEVYYLSNSSDRAYNGPLTFALPQDATPSDMAASLTWTTLGDQGVIEDTVPIAPGQRQINFTYSLPAATTYTLSRTVPLPIDQLNFLVESGSFSVSSPELTPGDTLDMSGTSFDDYTGTTLQAGTPLDIVLTQGSAASTGNRVGVWLGVIGVIIVVLGGIFFFRSRGNRAEPAYAGPAQGNDSSRWDELLDELAALDDRRDAGTITEEEYRIARDRAKAELKEIMGREDGGGGE